MLIQKTQLKMFYWIHRPFSDELGLGLDELDMPLICPSERHRAQLGEKVLG